MTGEARLETTERHEPDELSTARTSSDTILGRPSDPSDTAVGPQMLEVVERKRAELHESLLPGASEPAGANIPSASVVVVWVFMTVTLAHGFGHVNKYFATSMPP